MTTNNMGKRYATQRILRVVDTERETYVEAMLCDDLAVTLRMCCARTHEWLVNRIVALNPEEARLLFRGVAKMIKERLREVTSTVPGQPASCRRRPKD